MTDDRYVIQFAVEGRLPNGDVAALGATMWLRDKEALSEPLFEYLEIKLKLQYPGVTDIGSFWGTPYLIELEDDE